MVQIEKRRSYSESIYNEEWLSNLYIEQYKIYPHFYAVKYCILKIKETLEYLTKEGFVQFTSYKKQYEDTNRIYAYETYKLNDILISLNIDSYQKKEKTDRVYGIYILYQPKDTEYVKNLCEALVKLKRRASSKPKISIIAKDSDGLNLNSYYINKIKLDVGSNYNDDFKDIDALIKQKLSKENKGIVLLHGDPGTGKTSYIRHLTTKIKKNIIFVPTYMGESLATPEFLSFMLDYGKNSVLLIEDGENIIKSRTAGGNTAVSNLLNISDGILGDILNCQIIITFNCDLQDIDEALYRKGRIIAKYKFTKLKQQKAKELANLLDLDAEITSDMCLTDIYNLNQKSFKEERKRIGF